MTRDELNIELKRLERYIDNGLNNLNTTHVSVQSPA